MSDLYWVCETKKFVTMYQLLTSDFIYGIDMEEAMIDYLHHRGDMEHFFDDEGELRYDFASLYLANYRNMILEFLFYCLENFDVDEEFCYSYEYDEHNEVIYLSRLYKVTIKDGIMIIRKKEEKRKEKED